MAKCNNFQEIISKLSEFWVQQGCLLWHPYHEAVGAGTGNPATLLRVLGPEDWNVAYLEPSFRPDDGRFAENPNRLQMHHQFQVILKPPPSDPTQLYLDSLSYLGLDRSEHDLRFVEDNWESPALGAWGLGWEVWLNGMEITQFTYFQQAGGLHLEPPACEITYGLERIAMALLDLDSVWDLQWTDALSYRDLLHAQEVEYCEYDFNVADVESLRTMYQVFEAEAKRCIEKDIVLPGYDYVLRCSHTFNLLDSRGAIGVAERVKYFGQMRGLCQELSERFVAARKSLGFPLKTSSQNATDKASVSAFDPPSKGSANYVLEIGCEEISDAVVPKFIKQFQDWVIKGLEDQRLEYGSLEVCATPRRLVLFIEALQVKQADRELEVVGPPKDLCEKNPKVLESFCSKNDVAPEDLQFKEIKGAERAFVAKVEIGLGVDQVVPEIVVEAFAKISCGKRMRWLPDECYEEQLSSGFNRPVRWIVSLYDDRVLPLSLFGVVAGNQSRAGRWLNSELVEVDSVDAYKKFITSAGIILSQTDRREFLEQQVVKLAEEIKGVAQLSDGLADEIVYMTEAPQLFLAAFDERFADLPDFVKERIITKHVRCVPVYTDDGKLLNKFIGIGNGIGTESATVRAGFEKVVRARLADAEFFIAKDLETSREYFENKIKTLIHHAKVGSMYDKSQRLVASVAELSKLLKLSDEEAATLNQAVQSAKFDLGTQMVFEIQSLQGEIAAYYSERQGLDPEVCEIIGQQYLPRYAGDQIPESKLACVLALADKIDNLVSFFIVGERPTGSSDPYALRREAGGILSILTQGSLDIGLSTLYSLVFKTLDQESEQSVIDDLDSFVAIRLEALFRESGYRLDLIRAVLARLKDNPYQSLVVLSQLSKLVEHPSFEAIISAHVRCHNILAKNTEEIGVNDSVDSNKFVDDVERKLWDVVEKLVVCDDYSRFEEYFLGLTELSSIVDEFFDGVMVLDPDQDLRKNRLSLIKRVQQNLDPFFDLSIVSVGS